MCVEAISRYYFDGSGKGIRPQITRLVADACNEHLKVRRGKSSDQIKIPYSNVQVSSPETVSLQKDICLIREGHKIEDIFHSHL